jgi:FkbM family methyltransferase
MKNSAYHRFLGVLRDVLTSRIEPGLPLSKVFDRNYMAAWSAFRDFDRASVETLVDIGAHEGLYAARAARYFSLKRTILVEPLPKFAKNLRKLNLPGAEVVEAAMADKVGEARFTVSNTEQASSLLEINPTMSDAYKLDMSESQRITVKVTTLDQTVSDLGLESIDLVKIDVQGAERALLAGASSALKRTKYIQIEVLFVEHYKGCAQFFEIDSIMSEAGFRLCRLVDFSHTVDGVLLQADAIYLNCSRDGDRLKRVGNGH